MEKHKGNIIAPLLLLLAFGLYPLSMYLIGRSSAPTGNYAPVLINDEIDATIKAVAPTCDWKAYQAKTCGMDVETESGQRFFIMLEEDESLSGLSSMSDLMKSGVHMTKKIGSPRVLIDTGVKSYDLLIDF